MALSRIAHVLAVYGSLFARTGIDAKTPTLAPYATNEGLNQRDVRFTNSHFNDGIQDPFFPPLMFRDLSGPARNRQLGRQSVCDAGGRECALPTPRTLLPAPFQSISDAFGARRVHRARPMQPIPSPASHRIQGPFRRSPELATGPQVSSGHATSARSSCW